MRIDSPAMNTTLTSSFERGSSKPRHPDKPLLYVELVGWNSVYCLVAIATIINNSLVIAVLRTRKILRKRTNYFLLCLATADLLVGAISIPLYIAALVLWWQRGESLNPIRTVYATVDILIGYASMFSLTVVAVERLCAIATPLKHRRVSSRTYHVLICGIWLLAASHSAVYLMKVNVPAFPKSLFFYMMRVTSFLSFFVLCVAYTAIYLKVRSRKRHIIQVAVKAVARERLLLEKSFILSVIFVATWLPFNVLTFVGKFCGNCSDITYQVIFVVKLFHFLNSLINPFVYSFRDRQFRKILLNMCKKLHNSK